MLTGCFFALLKDEPLLFSDHSTPPLTLLPDGEVIGSVLIGLVHAFTNIRAISAGAATHWVDGIESTAWYPMSHFFAILEEVCVRDIDYAPILFRAGAAFIEDWYTHGGGKAQITCAGDFLRLQGSNGGYAAVHRGDTDKIGWQDLLELDESAGRAAILCVNPYPKDFECGLFYGGLRLTGDMQYVQVDSIVEPYNRHLNKKTITLRFRTRPNVEVDCLLEQTLADMSPDKPLALSESLSEALAWRLKGVEEQYRADRLYYQQSSLLLSIATAEIHALSRTLARLAHHDELTGLLNRRAVFEHAKRLLSLSARHDWTLSFVMVDIDRFKSINDRWGHAVGDETLRFVSALLTNRLRDSDLLGRIGGEEFLIVLPDTDADKALGLAEKLRREVARHVQRAPTKRRIPVTISLGVTVAVGREFREVEHYVLEADHALYRSKNNGRNQVTLFTAFSEDSRR